MVISSENTALSWMPLPLRTDAHRNLRKCERQGENILCLIRDCALDPTRKSTLSDASRFAHSLGSREVVRSNGREKECLK